MDLRDLMSDLHFNFTTATTLLVLVATLYLAFRVLRPDVERPVDFTIKTPDQCAPGWKGKTLDEPSIKAEGSTAIQCYAPATGQLLGFVNPTTQDGIDRSVAKASAAQIEWAKTSFAERRRVLKTLRKHLLDNADTIARVACVDSGKTLVDALLGEIFVTAERLRWTIANGERALKTETRPTNFMFYKRNEIRYEPLGVVAACVSWNYPVHNVMGPIISALFSGNAIIVKNSELTAWSSRYVAELVHAALTACGHSPDLVHVISCWPETANYLTSHPGISHLTFIGSRPIAHHVAKSASKSLTPLCIELGGKDAAIVLDHPKGKAEHPEEISRVASLLMRGVFQSSGQNCIGIERIVAMPQAYERLANHFKSKIPKLRPGNDLDEDPDAQGVDMGAMVSPASFSRLEGLIAEAVAQGANLVTGGHRYKHPKYPKGHYFQPTMLMDVTPDMRIAQEEVFAPICLMIRAKSPDDAISIVNSTPYGLAGSVFGPVSSAAARSQLQRVADSMKTGMVSINDFAATYAVHLPFGGTRGSGYGRFAGDEGLRSLCNAKSVCNDRWPWMLNTTIPSKLDYPMRPEAWNMGRGIVEVAYGEGVSRWISGIKRML